MRGAHIKIITGIALLAIFLLQGMWLYNTYSLLEKELKEKLDNVFARSIEGEIFLRLENLEAQIKPGEKVEGTKPGDSSYSNALAFHEFLLTYNNSFSLENLDSIWKQKLAEEDMVSIKYFLFITDSAGNITQQINQGVEKDTHFNIHLKKPIRKDHSEYIQVIIESPYKVILKQMFLLLIASLMIAIIIGYCFYLQIKIIIRQDRMAEIRKDFTHAMIHDMKNPVTTILMSTNALKSGKLDDKIQMKNQYFSIILKEGEHLLALANKILTIARLEEKKVNLSKSDIDLKKLFDSLIEDYKLESTKEVQFSTNLDNAGSVYADSEHMYEIFKNLIDNAIKYSKESVIIDISSDKNEHDTLIKIRDNGIGISLNDQKRIFNKFERIYSRKGKKISGFGLGLNYVHQAVIAHGGDIKIESIPDLYTEFTIIIPNKKNDQTVTD